MTVNLESALRHLRYAFVSRLLWVDALCINQNNNHEKTHQVKLMGDIYRRTRQGLIWLGDLESLYIYSNLVAFSVVELVEFMANLDHEISPQCPSHSKFSYFSTAFDALYRLLGSRWWSRIWTLQEIALPKQALVIWGPVSLPWAQFSLAALSFKSHFELCGTCHSRLGRYGYWKESSIADKFTTSVSDIMHVKELQLPTATCGPSSSFEVLCLCQMREATNPKDKILGLLGLLPYWSFGAQVINYYDLDVIDLYQRATLALIQDSRNLAPFIVASRGRSRNYPSLPSWAVDWSVPLDSFSQVFIASFASRYSRYQHYSANSSWLYEPKLNPDNRTIFLKGTYIGRVRDLGKTARRGLFPAASRVNQLNQVRYWQSLGEEIRSHGKYGRRWYEEYLRTILGDLVIDNRKNWAHRIIIDDDFPSITDYIGGEFRADMEVDRIADSISDMITNRRFFNTDEGYMGIGPINMRVDDEVWVLFGGQVPFVLRRLKSSPPTELSGHAGAPPLHYTLVGDSYVHGVMKGEAVKGKENDATTIVLH